MKRYAARLLLALVTMAPSAAALAQAPGIGFTPPGNQPGVDLVLVPQGSGVADASIELFEAVPGDGGDTPASLTTMFCTLGGDANIDFAAQPSFSFQGSIGGSPSVDLTCVQDAALVTTATVGCFEKRAGVSQPDRIFDIQCPSSGAVTAPELEASPVPGTTLDIDTTQPTNGTTTFTISNVGSATLNVTSITGLAAPFSVSPPSAPIPAGGNQVFTVTCNAAAAGVFFDGLTVNSNDADEGAIAYQVDCTVNAVSGQEFESVPAPPGPIDLANTAGAPPTSASITITNAGSGTLNISNLSGLVPPLSRTIGQTALAAGASTAINVFCDSAGAASSSQSLTFNTDDPDDGENAIAFTVNCNVSAGTAPEFASSPGTPGPIAISTSTGVQGQAQLFVQNVGTADLNVTLGTAPTAPVTVAGLPLTLTPGSAAQPVTVSCQNGGAGSFSRNFTLATNDPSEASVPFTVNCNVVAGAAPEFDTTPAAPGPLTITTNQGVTGSSNVTVRNIGTSTLTINSITPSSATFSALPTAPINIAPGAQTNLSVRCFNNTPGDYAGTVTLSTNDASENTVPFTVNCRVNLVAPEYDSSPRAGSTFAFYVKSSETIQVVVRITNSGNAPLTYSLSGLSGALSSAPAIGGPYNLNAGLSQNIVVSCNGALLLGNVVQNLSITHNDSGESPALYRIDCRPDIRLSALPLLRTVLGAPIATEPATLLLDNGFE
ncbi:MAG TPA: choice-of-anchor D domain-containing protein [Xanthomonadales bacterium]|nr:choice-of-anchor D domain-containing protein [Xanthomonadales bacterium]